MHLVSFLGPMTFPGHERYWALVEWIASDSLEERLGLSEEEIRSQWTWAPGSSYLNSIFTQLVAYPECVARYIRRLERVHGRHA